MLTRTRRRHIGHNDSASTLTCFCGAVIARTSWWHVRQTRVWTLSVQPSQPPSVTSVSAGSVKLTGCSKIRLWTARPSRKVWRWIVHLVELYGNGYVMVILWFLFLSIYRSFLNLIFCLCRLESFHTKNHTHLVPTTQHTNSFVQICCLILKKS